jgi:hypothetical protein
MSVSNQSGEKTGEKMSALPNALIGKTPESILEPQPIMITLYDRKTKEERHFEVFPMNDSSLMVISESMLEIVGLFESASNELPTLDDPEFPAELQKILMTQLPRIIAVILPNASRLIAASLSVDVEWVRENVTIAQKLEAIKAIIEAEDIPLLLKNFAALVGIFPKIVPALTETTQTNQSQD